MQNRTSTSNIACVWKYNCTGMQNTICNLEPRPQVQCWLPSLCWLPDGCQVVHAEAADSHHFVQPYRPDPRSQQKARSGERLALQSPRSAFRMSRKNTSGAEELTNLNRRVAETATKLGRKRIALAMAQCPSCISHLVNTPNSLGYDDDRL